MLVNRRIEAGRGIGLLKHRRSSLTAFSSLKHCRTLVVSKQRETNVAHPTESEYFYRCPYHLAS